MNIVQPGSAMVNSNSALSLSTWTHAARRCPTTGSSTSTGISTSSHPRSATACPRRPSPSMRTPVGLVHPATPMRTSCSGASGGPTNSSVEATEITCMSAPYDSAIQLFQGLRQRAADFHRNGLGSGLDARDALQLTVFPEVQIAADRPRVALGQGQAGRGHRVERGDGALGVHHLVDHQIVAARRADDDAV